MLSVRLKPELADRLDKLAHDTHRSKSYYVERALEKFLEEEEACLLALSRWEKIESGASKLIFLEEIEKEMNMKHES